MVRRMRILLWHGYLLGGTGSNVYTRSLAREWSRAGHDVTVFAQEPRPEDYDLGGASVVRPDIGGLLPTFVPPGVDADEFVLLPRHKALRDLLVESHAEPPNPDNANERLPDEGNAERFEAFLADDEPTVLYFGKLLRNKGVHVLFEALRDV